MRSDQEIEDEDEFFAKGAHAEYEFIVFANLEDERSFQIMKPTVKSDAKETLDKIFGFQVGRAMTYDDRSTFRTFTKGGVTQTIAMFARVQRGLHKTQLIANLKRLNNELKNLTGQERMAKYVSMVKVFYDKMLIDFNYPEIGKETLICMSKRTKRGEIVEMPMSTDDERLQRETSIKDAPSASTATAAKMAKSILADTATTGEELSQDTYEAAGISQGLPKTVKKATPAKKRKSTLPPPKNPPNTRPRRGKRNPSPISLSDNDSQSSAKKQKVAERPPAARKTRDVFESSDDDFASPKPPQETSGRKATRSSQRQLMDKPTTSKQTEDTFIAPVASLDASIDPNSTFLGETSQLEDPNTTFGGQPATGALDEKSLDAAVKKFANLYIDGVEEKLNAALEKAMTKKLTDEVTKSVIKAMTKFFESDDNPIRKELRNEVKLIASRQHTQSIQQGKLVSAMNEVTRNFNLLSKTMLNAIKSIKELADTKAELESRGVGVLGQLLPFDVMGKCADVVFSFHVCQELIFYYLKQHVVGLAGKDAFRAASKAIFEKCFNPVARGHLIFGESVGAWKQIEWFKRPIPAGYLTMVKTRLITFISAWMKNHGIELTDNYAVFKTVVAHLCSNGRNRLEEIASLGAFSDEDYQEKLYQLDVLFYNRNKHTLPKNKKPTSLEAHRAKVGTRNMPKGGTPLPMDYPECYDVIRPKALHDDIDVYDTICLICVAAFEAGKNWRVLTFDPVKSIPEIADVYKKVLDDHINIQTIVERLKSKNLFCPTDLPSQPRGNARDNEQGGADSQQTDAEDKEIQAIIDFAKESGASPRASIHRAMLQFEKQRRSPLKRLTHDEESLPEAHKESAKRKQKSAHTDEDEALLECAFESDSEEEEEDETDEEDENEDDREKEDDDKDGPAGGAAASGSAQGTTEKDDDKEKEDKTGETEEDTTNIGDNDGQKDEITKCTSLLDSNSLIIPSMRSLGALSDFDFFPSLFQNDQDAMIDPPLHGVSF